VFNVSRSNGAIIAISQSVSGIKCRFDLELIIESVWIEIKIHDFSNLRIGNHYFPPDKSKIVKLSLYMPWRHMGGEEV
jgi:hypothetical protein